MRCRLVGKRALDCLHSMWHVPFVPQNLGPDWYLSPEVHRYTYWREVHVLVIYGAAAVQLSR